MRPPPSRLRLTWMPELRTTDAYRPTGDQPSAIGTLADALRDLRLRDAQFRAFAASLRARRRPTLAFIHSILPHHPWRYLPSGRQYADATTLPGLDDDVWTPDAMLVEPSYARHLLQVAFVDRLGR